MVGEGGRWHRRVALIDTPQDQQQAALELRCAFSAGPTSIAADVLVRQLEAGLGWQMATRAVAEGIADRFGPSLACVAPQSRVPFRQSKWSAIALGLLLYLLAAPVLSIARELVIGGLAMCFRLFVATGWWQPVVTALRLDPIYADAAIRSLATIQPQGVAVAGPLGAELHRLIPGVFITPEYVVTGAFTSLVAVPGGSLLERALITFTSDVLILLLGLACATSARGRPWLAVFGLLVQAQIALGHLLALHVSSRELDSTGVPFAVALAFPSTGWWLSGQLGRLPETWQSAIIGSVLLLLTYAAALTMAVVLRAARLVVRRDLQLNRRTGTHLSRLTWALTIFIAILAICSPVGTWGRGASNWQPGIDRSISWTPVQPARLTVLVPQSELSGPHSVNIHREPDGQWEYLVDGTPEVIRGIGYNPQYAGLARSERARLYQRDFSEIRNVGANTIEGWFDSQFDELTLDCAARNGLGVILPYRLNNDWDYSDPAVQARVLQDVSTWVLRYRNNPALRMWAPGNENLHRMLYSKWVSADQLPQARVKAQAFAAFLPRLIDRIHELDPDHPVVYRDAEDVYLNWLQQGFSQSPSSRPWFVYGANVYSESRLNQIIASWPSQWLGGPLLISEFAPFSRGPAGRALGYAQDWWQIRADPGFVLGGLAYAWGTNGPEQLDRVFGLVNADGKPSDAALAALASVYQEDAALADLQRNTIPAPRVVSG